MKQEIAKEGKLNEVVIIQKKRPNKSLRIQQDFEFCPTRTEQHSAGITDLNILIEKFTPDEVSAYIFQKNQARQEITGHDFTNEPSLQEAKNVHYALKQAYERLDPELKSNFKNHVEFLKFIDNPQNQEKMIKLGLMTQKEINANTTNAPEATQERTQQESKPVDLPKKESSPKS